MRDVKVERMKLGSSHRDKKRSGRGCTDQRWKRKVTGREREISLVLAAAVPAPFAAAAFPSARRPASSARRGRPGAALSG